MSFDPDAYLAEKDNEAFDPDAYLASDQPAEMGFIQSQVQNLPIYGAGLGALAAGIPSGGLASIAGAGLGAGMGQSAKDIINRYAYDENKNIKDTLLDPAIAIAEGATSEMGGQIIGKALPLASKYVANSKLGKYVGDVSDKVGQSFRKTAGEFAENATGATGLQASKFKEGAGNELLDRGLVKFGDNAKKISGRVSGAVDESNAVIDSVLKELDSRGVTVSQDDIVAALSKKVDSLSKRASQADVVKKLNSVIDNIVNTGESKISISAAELEKRGFNQQAGNWLDPEKAQAGKTAYQSYRGAVEDAAIASDPSLADAFVGAKKTYGLLAPIKEAAERRASTLNQSPIGGFLDTATTGVGAVVGGAPVGVVSAVGRRLLAPRVSSSVAVTLDKISKSLLKSPQMLELSKTSPKMFEQMVSRLSQKGLEKLRPEEAKPPINKNNIMEKTQGSKYAQVLQNAAGRGEQAFSANHFILMNRDEKYRQLFKDEE